MRFFFFFFFFVSRLNAQDLHFAWAKNMGGAQGSSYAYAITTDVTGNVYTTGYFTGVVDFDPGPAVINFTAAGTVVLIR